MKTLLLLVLAIFPLPGFPQSPPNPRLTGIINVDNLKLAIIQTSPPQSLEVALSEGLRAEAVEVFTINATNRSVTARFSTNAQPDVLALTNPGADTVHGPPGFTLEGVTLQTVLNLLAVFSDRTILQHPRLPENKFSLASAVTNRSEAAQILKNVLTERRIVVVPDGSKLLLVAPEEMASALNPRSAAANTNPMNTELFPPGSINFSSAPLGNVLIIYVELLGGKLDRTGSLTRDGKVFLKMHTALTKEECLYAFETLVGWHGIKLVSTEPGLFKAVSTD